MPLSKPTTRAPESSSSSELAPIASKSLTSASLPDDLASLPTYPPGSRYPQILPIDPAQARSALWHGSGNIHAAARLLSVSPARLASLVARDPYLEQERTAAATLLLDRAEQVMAGELEGQDAAEAAKWIIDRAGHRRGYGRDAKTQLSFGSPGTSGAIAIRWESE